MRVVVVLAAFCWLPPCAVSGAQTTPPVAVVVPAAEPARLDAHTFEVLGGIQPGHQPDGNSYIFEGSHGLVVIDTGRHVEHRQKIEALAQQLHKPVVAIINTHWHLDHVSGNADLRAANPGLKVYASSAIDQALTGFLAASAAETRKMIADGKLDAATTAEVQLDLATIEHGASLRPDVVVKGTRDETLGGVRLVLHLAKNAATAGDVWVFDPETQTAFVGDLVTFPAPFLDTACSQGWSTALSDVEKLQPKKIAPGHGPVLSPEQFSSYHAAFDALIACSKSDAAVQACANAWVDAVTPITKMSPAQMGGALNMTKYYVANVLRKNGGNSKYCAKID